MPEKTRDLVYSGSRSEQEKSLLAKRACVSQGCPKLKANFGFYGPRDNAGSEKLIQQEQDCSCMQGTVRYEVRWHVDYV